MEILFLYHIRKESLKKQTGEKVIYGREMYKGYFAGKEQCMLRDGEAVRP